MDKKDLVIKYSKGIDKALNELTKPPKAERIEMTLLRLKDNKFYIAYRRSRGKETNCPLYCIYRTKEYDGDMLGEYRTARELWKTFIKATQEAIAHERIING